MCEETESKLSSGNACYEYNFVQHVLLHLCYRNIKLKNRDIRVYIYIYISTLYSVWFSTLGPRIKGRILDKGIRVQADERYLGLKERR